MAKTKKEMKKAQANYVDIILRKNKYIKELQDKLKGWEEVNQLNQALVGAVMLETVGTGNPVAITRDDLTKVIEGYTVITKPTDDRTGFVLQLVMLNAEADKPAE